MRSAAWTSSLIEEAGAELGFLFRPDRWGRGLATEAVTAVVAQAFGPCA